MYRNLVKQTISKSNIFSNCVNKNGVSPLLRKKQQIQFDRFIEGARFYSRKRDENPNSFSNVLKQVLQQDLANNEELQKKIKELKNTGTAASAKSLSEKTKEFAESLKDASQPLAQTLKTSMLTPQKTS